MVICNKQFFRKALPSVNNFLIRNNYVVLKNLFFKKRRNLRGALMTFYYIRNSLYFVIQAQGFKMNRLVFSKSLKSIIAGLGLPNTAFFKSGGILKPQIWRPFFSDFFLKFPAPFLFLKICNWEGFLSPILQLLYSVKKVKCIFYSNRIPYSHTKYKKVRRIKKRLRKRLYKS